MNTDESVTVLEDSGLEDTTQGIQYKLHKDNLILLSQVKDQRTFKKLFAEFKLFDDIPSSKHLSIVSFPVISKEPTIKHSTSKSPVTTQVEYAVQTLNLDKKLIKRMKTQSLIIKYQKENERLLKQVELLQFALNKFREDSEKMKKLTLKNKQVMTCRGLNGENIQVNRHSKNTKDEVNKQLFRDYLKRNNSCKIKLLDRKLESTQPIKEKTKLKFKFYNDLKNQLGQLLNSKSACTKYEVMLTLYTRERMK